MFNMEDVYVDFFIQQKCLQYWPEEGDECTYGSINIKLTKTETFEDFVIRSLETRKVSL